MNKKLKQALSAGALCAVVSALVSVAASPSRAGGILVQSGQRVAFLGASVTERGWNLPAGYVRLVQYGLAANGVAITPIPAGVSGNTTTQMLARLQKDVLDKKPDWLVFCVGTNDVNRREPIQIAQSEANINSIIDESQRAGIKVMLMTTNTVGENLDNAHNRVLDQYDQFLKQAASQKGFPIADVNSGLAQGIARHKVGGNAVTVDGVHPNLRGNEIMATAILRAFGLGGSQLKKAQLSWQNIPNGWAVQAHYSDKSMGDVIAKVPKQALVAKVFLTVHQYDALEDYEESKGTTLNRVADVLYAQDVGRYFKSPGGLASVQAIYAANQQDTVQRHLQEELTKQVQDELKAGSVK